MSIEDAIQESLEDVVTPEPVDDTPEVEASTDTTDDAPETPQDAPEATEDTSPEVASPSAKAAPKAEPDEFEKKFGIPAQSASGRENRIPYSRVKKIVAKQVKEIESQWQPKVNDLETKFKEADTKIKDYEGRLTQVAEFERIMLQEHDKFINMLLSVPGYQEALTKKFAQTQQAQTQEPPNPDADMPQPDQKLPDGTMVYSMEGLKALNAWNRSQAQKEVLAQIEKDYAPIREQWQAQERIRQAIPQVQKQIEEARKWPQFNENEDAIVQALNANRSLTLEAAYRQVVLPKLLEAQDKLKVDRNALRAEILKELKQAPAATSAPSSSVKSNPITTGARSMEDVIAEAIKGLR